MELRCGAAIALGLLAAATAGAETPLFATRLDAEHHAALTPGGPDATGGVGDWALSNGTLCAVIADPAHETDLSPVGGALVDLGHCARGDDQLVVLQPLANLDRGGAVRVESVEAAADAHEARVTTRGRHAGCDVETRYALDRDDPRRLRIATHVVRREPGPRLFALGDVALHVQHALRPFAFDSRGAATASGFAHPRLDLASALSIARATRASDTRILVGARAIEPGIAYALRWTRAAAVRDRADEVSLPVLSLSAEGFSSLTVFASPFWMEADALGPLQMLQTLWMDLRVGDALVFERELHVAPRPDAASLTDRLIADAHPVTGSVDDPSARLAVEAPDGGVLTDVLPEGDGRFRFRAPPGAWRLRVLGPAGGETAREFRVGEGAVDLGSVAAPPVATLALPRGQPMRLTFVGLGTTSDPRFGDERPAVAFGDDRPPPSMLSRDFSLAGVASDPKTVTLAPGRYRVLAGRGPEHGVTEAHVELAPGAHAVLAIEPPPRVLDTPGWITADLHVHAAPSDDSALPLDTRVASFVAEGCEVMVATDHDHLTDYAPVIRELGLASSVASVVGQEISSTVPTDEAPHTFGHANAFPLPYRPLAYRKGALPNEGRRLRAVLAAVRALGGERLVQLNHPRSGGDARGLFDHLSVGTPFDPEAPLTLPPNAVLLARDPATGLRDLDFDAMELMNGPSLARYRQVREDWFALLRQGVVRTATANSDSHILREVAAAPRNLVRVEPDDPAAFDPAAFVRAVRAGRVVGTTGPIVDLHVGDAGIGEMHRGRKGAIQVDVAAAPWVPVARVRAFVNGVLAHETDVRKGRAVRFPHAFGADAFVTVEVEGAPDAVYAARLPDFTPFAFTNPVFVDADGDGAWTPPAPLAVRAVSRAPGRPVRP